VSAESGVLAGIRAVSAKRECFRLLDPQSAGGADLHAGNRDPGFEPEGDDGEFLRRGGCQLAFCSTGLEREANLNRANAFRRHRRTLPYGRGSRCVSRWRARI